MMTSLFRRLLRLIGWQLEGQVDPNSAFIMAVGPHTSNWDFIIGIIGRGALGTQINFLGKHQLFIPPWGWLFKAMGGSPVDRRKHNNLVDAAVQLYQQQPYYKLALAPEGTRSPVTRWKTGFYHIAVKANIDIVPVGLDFKRKTIVISAPFKPTNDIEKDMNALLDFFRTIQGRHPKVIPSYSATPTKTK
ncbi:lysophospholipid acyltransferase family protein [Shewanella intestini]|uniref:Acyltransferase n=1 Tax=Shewanella intestini TaxID=2017544 RepID=A0ABS5I3L4_9GAMM|nr:MULTISPECIES: lysophospholipid acyltransferase family protein [Shewanella]MBR9728614.1 acyltransferase [Shewanella intestini]MRG37330.1 acyltransferase [Shewanella sp. XMDDZSB0408]